MDRGEDDEGNPVYRYKTRSSEWCSRTYPGSTEDLDTVLALLRRGCFGTATRSPLRILGEAGEDFFAVEIERRVMQDYIERGLAHAAAAEGDIDALFRLHAAGCDLWVTDSKGRTPAHIAAARNMAGCLHMLGTSGYDIDSTDDDYRTPCHDAAQNGHLDILQLMADICKFNHLVLTEKDKYGRNVAHEAAEHGQKECLKFILEDPAAIWIRDEQDVYLQTPAHVAALDDNWGCYHLLEEFGCDFELMDDRGYTAAEMVCYKEERRIGDDWFRDRRTSSADYFH